MFKRLYHWTLSLAESRYATWALAGVAFAESSFFPLPPDLVLVPMALARPKRALWYATICTIASVIGGLLGYAIGALLYDTIGHWLIGLYGLEGKAAALEAEFASKGWIVILAKGATPIPFKLVTIVCGFLHYDLALFVLLSIITRGARFFIEAALLARYGEPIKPLLERYFLAFMLIIILFVVLGFWIAGKFV